MFPCTVGVVSHDVEKLTGRKPLEVRDLLDEYSYVWKKIECIVPARHIY